jgi:hypothetical protein
LQRTRVPGVFFHFLLSELQHFPGLVRIRDPRASENDDRGNNIVLLKKKLGFQQLQLEPDRAQFVPEDEIPVQIGQTVRGGLGLRVSMCSLAAFASSWAEGKTFTLSWGSVIA